MAKIFQTRSRSKIERDLSDLHHVSPLGILIPFRRTVIVLSLILITCLTASACHAQARDVLCHDGVGDFETEFHAGVKVRVGAGRNQELAARVCEASLSWGNQNLVVASAATELDIDAFGVDMGVGAPVVAMQVKQSKGDCCMAYSIYTLQQPPVLVRRITGGEYFSAADTDLDGRVEVWTDDAAAVDGFENLRLLDLDFPPPVVLRFTRGKLQEVGAEFRPYFDKKIAAERAKLNPEDLADFKASDGKLTPGSIQAVRLSRLRSAKMKVLEIVWSYLYSGREKDAWTALADMWPAADLDRIRGAITDARAHGIRSQIDGVLTATRAGHAGLAKIFDGTVVITSTPEMAPKGTKPPTPIVPPKAILMERLPPTTPAEQELAKLEATLKMVIDSAGKVRSVEVLGDPE
ncbi:MAG TPA: hypothetical protein VGI34_11020, partial [Candidatus Acidoferrales bacterium]